MSFKIITIVPIIYLFRDGFYGSDTIFGRFFGLRQFGRFKKNIFLVTYFVILKINPR